MATNISSNYSTNNSININTPQGSYTVRGESGQVSSNGNQPSLELKSGDTINGEIVSRDGNDIQLRVTKDIILNARLDQDIQAGNGDQVTFEIRANSAGNISLRPLFQNMSQESPVFKALKQAGIPVDGKSSAMVEAMMKEGMSIDSESLQMMYKDVYDMPDTSVNTLVQLSKLQLSPTQENIGQFEAYKSFEHQLKDAFNFVADQISGAVEEEFLSGTAKSGNDLMGKLLDAFSFKNDGLRELDIHSTRGEYVPELSLGGDKGSTIQSTLPAGMDGTLQTVNPGEGANSVIISENGVPSGVKSPEEGNNNLSTALDPESVFGENNTEIARGINENAGTVHDGNVAQNTNPNEGQAVDQITNGTNEGSINAASIDGGTKGPEAAQADGQILIQGVDDSAKAENVTIQNPAQFNGDTQGAQSPMEGAKEGIQPQGNASEGAGALDLNSDPGNIKAAAGEAGNANTANTVIDQAGNNEQASAASGSERVLNPGASVNNANAADPLGVKGSENTQSTQNRGFNEQVIKTGLTNNADPVTGRGIHTEHGSAGRVFSDEGFVQNKNDLLGQNETVHLSPKDALELANLLKNAGGSPELAERILQGKATGDDIYEAVRNLSHRARSEEDINSVKELFVSRGFQSVLKDRIGNQWNLRTPQQVEKQEIKDLYERIERQTRDIARALSDAARPDSPLARSVMNIRENMDFMNQLNQLTSYVQLPMKWQGMDAHGDLYVYTNKKNLAGKDGHVSAFLHLEMQHLGVVDVYVSLERDRVATNFTVEDDETLELLDKNMDILTKRLEDKGYITSAKLAKKGDETGSAEDGAMAEILKEKRNISVVSMQAFDVRA